ncbi:redoxin domain-containing protein [Planctomicrobium sp.]|jgi:thiol-disulfide isomerase/thioredoxin|nr:redoxin domain-containing protein [Planctomicrobium sp.]MBT5017430.1 redoxin domain-containing protein [Planctomicrobium sp.]MDB4733071.1 redoxin domain-containing protein [Planctomicrobium sp.]MDB4743824.1 redoxin domain-containing protein [Planctomicrobium sp.]
MFASNFIRANVYLLTFSVCMTSTSFAQEVGPETVLGYRPSHPVEIETPTGADIKKCELKVEQEGKGSGWALYGPQGQLLRRFMDTDADGKVDQFKYFQYGLEVYRDLDTDGDNKVDQSRWFNTQGTRWGVDSDQDGTIESWKIISAEEASREAIIALVTKNPQRLNAIFINKDDIASLGIASGIATKFLANGRDLAQQMQSVLSTSKLITPQAKWVRFDSSMLMPNLIPADSGKAKDDLLVYENVMAIVSSGEENGFVQIGEMVRVGNTWKLTQFPKPMEGAKFELGEGGLLLQPTIAGLSPGTTEGLSPEMREMLDRLRELDEKSPNEQSSREEITQFNVARARLLENISELSESPEDKLLWFRQRLEMIAAATQMETFPNGLAELQRIVKSLRDAKADEELLAFAAFQEMLVRYNISLQTAEAEDRADVQGAWLSSLEEYVKEFPKAPESADALLQLAITNEFNGDLKEATVWYTKLVNDYQGSDAAKRGQGALRRLSLKGKPIALAGNTLAGGRPLNLASYRGKVTAVIFWATWCKPCTEDLPQIQELYKTYQRKGFEVVGVNLDSPGADIDGYIKNYGVVWPNIHEEGGLESRPALEYGIISLPTMFLVDKTGKVVSNGSSVEDLKKLVPELLK